MKVGDLVKIKPYCHCAGEIGIVTSPPDELNSIVVILTTTGKSMGALADNVEVINEKK